MSLAVRVRAEQVPRLLAVVACVIATFAGVSGATQDVLFAAPSLLKYMLTVLAPVIGIILLTSRHPLRIIVALTIICIPFADAGAHFGGEQVTLLTAVLALAVIVAIVSGGRPDSLSSLGIVCVVALTLLIAPLLIGHDSGGVVILTGMVLVGWLTSRVVREGDEAVSVVYWAVTIAAVIQAVIAIYEFKTNHRLNLYGSAGSAGAETGYFGTAAGHAGEAHTTERPSGTLYDPISLGNILALSCPIIVVLAARTRSVTLRLALIGAGVVVALGLGLSFSRFSWIGGGVGTVIACLVLPSPRLRARALAIAAVVVAAAAVLAVSTAGPHIVSRLETISNPTHAANRISAKGDRERVEAWHADVRTFLEHPLAGVGLGRIRYSLARYLPKVKEASNGQNTYLQIAAEAGLLGLAALALVIGGAGVALVRGLRTSPVLAAGALGGGAAILIVWLTDVTIRYTPVAAFFAIILGVAAALPTLPSPNRISVGR